LAAAKTALYRIFSRAIFSGGAGVRRALCGGDQDLGGEVRRPALIFARRHAHADGGGFYGIFALSWP